jgi:hypothetical protein
MTKRYDRKAAAEYLAETFGIRLAHRTFEALPIPYVVVLGRALYTAVDLDAFATRQLQDAPRRVRRAPPTAQTAHLAKANLNPRTDRKQAEAA